MATVAAGRNQLAGAVRDATRRALDLMFPPRCDGCGALGREWFCERCVASLRRIRPPICARCGDELPGDVAVCASCARHPLPDALAGIGSVARFEGPLRSAIHALKYDGRTILAEPLGDLLARELAAQEFPTDFIVPVPLHPRRERERGYNQSALLAAVVSRRAGVPVERGLLVRVRDTHPQVTMLSADARRANIAGAFEATRRLDGEHILLIDDVATTGATMAECAQALTTAGAGKIWGLTLAR